MTKRLTTAYILSRFDELGVEAFRMEEFRRLFDLPPQKAYAVLHRLAAGGVVRRIGKGRYVVVGLGRREVLGQPFFLASRLVEPSYVGFWSALHFYGWTEQVPRVVFVANTRRTGRRTIEAFRVRLVKLSPTRFFGYTTARQGDLEFPMAEPEKAIVDGLYLPEHSGGVGLVAEALGEAIGALDRDRLVSYAASIGVRSVCSRLGHLLRGLGVEASDLRTCASRTYVKLDPSGSRRGRYDAEWRVIDNLRGAF